LLGSLTPSVSPNAYALGWLGQRFVDDDHEREFRTHREPLDQRHCRLVCLAGGAFFALGLGLDIEQFGGASKVPSYVFGLRLATLLAGALSVLALSGRPSYRRIELAYIAFWTLGMLTYCVVVHAYVTMTGRSMQTMYYPLWVLLALLAQPGSWLAGIVAASAAVVSATVLNALLLPNADRLPALLLLCLIAFAIAAAAQLGPHRERRTDYANLRLVEARSQKLLRARDLLQEQLVHAQKTGAMGMLAGGVAHDFNNALTAILVSAELLEADLKAGNLDAEEGAAFLEEIIAAGRHASGLTRQLLLFGKRRKPNPECAQLDALVEEVAELLRRLVPAHVQYDVELNAGDASVLIDRTHLEQILSNLVVNGAEAMPTAGSLRVRTYASDDGAEAVLEVSDTGSGIPEAARERLFEPFFTTKQAATGIGLATVKLLVEEAGGSVELADSGGEGTRVMVSLPRVASRVSEAVSLPAPSTGRRAKPASRRVLVCDDDARIRRLADATLSRAGFEVVTADTPGEALGIATASDSRFSLLLTDVVMPGLNGRELADRVRKKCPGISVLYMSGYTDGIVEPTAGGDGGHFIAKPFSTRVLVEQVETILGEAEASVSAQA